jgi:type III pantothenate kinase
VIDDSGAYAGAIIAPGLDVAADALARATAGLPRIDLVAPARAIADTTVGGLQSGLVLGYLGLVEGLIDEVRRELGPAPTVATGDAQWAPLLAEASPLVDAYEPLLTLDGLRRIHDRATIERPVRLSR